MIDVNPTTSFPNMYNFINDRLVKKVDGNNLPTMDGSGIMPLVLFSIVIFCYYLIFSYLGVGNNSEATQTSGGVKLIEIIMWGMFIFLILINGLQYFLKIDIKATVKNLFSSQPAELDFNITNKDTNNNSGNGETMQTAETEETMETAETAETMETMETMVNKKKKIVEVIFMV